MSLSQTSERKPAFCLPFSIIVPAPPGSLSSLEVVPILAFCLPPIHDEGAIDLRPSRILCATMGPGNWPTSLSLWLNPSGASGSSKMLRDLSS